jgi:hypothetical protein
MRSAVAAGKDDGSRDILVRPDDQLGLNREPRATKPIHYRAGPTMVAVDVDWTTRVALGRVSSLVADVEADQ